MPSRILRDHTDSFRFEHLSAEGERLFHRVIQKADDYGRFSADPRLLRSGCFPLTTNLRDTDISRWLAECQKAGLFVVYQVQGRSYLAVVNFRQRLRQMKGKFPPPDGKASDWQPDDGDIIDGQLPVNCPSTDGQKRNDGKRRDSDLDSEEDSEESPLSPQGGEGAKPTPFDRFWEAYPRKEGKGKAEPAFGRKKCAAIIDQILAAIARQRLWPKWLEEGGRFIPHPTTWINGERWLDEGISSNNPHRRFIN